MTSNTKSKIYLFFETAVSLRERTRLKQTLLQILKDHGREIESLNFVFSTDQRLLEINRQYLQHDYYTDIISFELSSRTKPLIGEIYISVDRVRENARQLGQTFKRELHRVIIHGVLHLCGYKDKTQAQIKEMREKEEFYLKKYS